MIFVGDVHGKFKQYLRLLGSKPTIQVGDLGLGFRGSPNLARPHPEQHRFIRGNHDNPLVCRRYSNYLGDYGYLDGQRLFFVSGAHSIDRDWRIEGASWWADEQLTDRQMLSCAELYKRARPRFVVTHEGPLDIVRKMFWHLSSSHDENDFRNPTSNFLQHLLELHPPEVWIFGHHHVSKDEVFNGTRFICLAELETIELKLGGEE